LEASERSRMPSGKNARTKRKIKKQAKLANENERKHEKQSRIKCKGETEGENPSGCEGTAKWAGPKGTIEE